MLKSDRINFQAACRKQTLILHLVTALKFMRNVCTDIIKGRFSFSWYLAFEMKYLLTANFNSSKKLFLMIIMWKLRQVQCMGAFSLATLLGSRLVVIWELQPVTLFSVITVNITMVD